MRINDFVTEEELADLDEKASRALCTSSRPNSSLGASNLSSCKAQGLRARTGHKLNWINGKRVPVAGHKAKSVKYGGSVIGAK